MTPPRFIIDMACSAGLPDDLAHSLATELSAPHRHYHGIQHHALMLKQLDGSRTETLACLYHDIVYDARAADNEERSAAQAERELARLVPELLPRITTLILATKGHRPTGDAQIDRFLHADLWILAAPEATYDWYARGVRLEYAHVPDDAFAKGRSAVLAGLFEACAGLFSPEEQAQMLRNINRERAAL